MANKTFNMIRTRRLRFFPFLFLFFQCFCSILSSQCSEIHVFYFSNINLLCEKVVVVAQQTNKRNNELSTATAADVTAIVV